MVPILCIQVFRTDKSPDNLRTVITTLLVSCMHIIFKGVTFSCKMIRLRFAGPITLFCILIMQLPVNAVCYLLHTG